MVDMILALPITVTSRGSPGSVTPLSPRKAALVPTRLVVASGIQSPLSICQAGKARRYASCLVRARASFPLPHRFPIRYCGRIDSAWHASSWLLPETMLMPRLSAHEVQLASRASTYPHGPFRWSVRCRLSIVWMTSERKARIGTLLSRRLPCRCFHGWPCERGVGNSRDPGPW